jgi:predicted amidohydrolase YtcJ
MEPTIIFLNGDIHTMDEENPVVEAVAVHGNRIISVGSTADVRGLAGSETEVVDLKGRTMIPGMTDAHVHFTSYALVARRVDLDGATTLEETLKRVGERAARARRGEWILGRGWNKNLWEGGGFPSKGDLDRVARDKPVALNSKGGHVTWVNSAALRLAGITRDTPQPYGGEIERDPETGEPTGILKEKAQALMTEILPEPEMEEITEATLEAIRDFQGMGITAISDSEGTVPFMVFQNLLNEGRLGLRISMMFPADNLDAAIKFGVQSGFGNDMLRIVALKLFTDGALGPQTAAMLEAYEDDPENRGILRLTKEELAELVYRATSHGIGVAVHCIGDRANRVILDVFEENKRRVGAVGSVRYRVEHAQHLTEEDMGRFGRLGVISSMQPIHIALDMDVADRFVGRRARWAYPFRTLLDTGAVLAFGSDAPVVSFNPFLGIYTAVMRKRDPDYPPGGWYPEERITVEEALRAYTVGGAYATGQEDVRGTISPGKLADMAVLSKNIFEIQEDDIRDVEVEMTIFDGEIVYKR